MGDMAEDVAIAIEQGQKFSIFGDFDVDGATSSAVLHRFLKSCGIDAPVYIPDRLTEGYGPNVDALRQIKAQGADILMMLDCGTTAFDVIAAGAEMGLKIIILDHHEAEEALPQAWHLINPKRKDDTSGFSVLAAVGVTFLACVAINSRLRERGFYAARNIAEPNLKSLIDLVALGTVCDMVPLQRPNRLFVRHGLLTPSNAGISALMQTAKINAPLSTFDCGFVLGPRINAGSRIDKADLGATLLCSEDAEECKNIAWTLHDCNEKRKAIQQEMEEQAVAMVQQKGLENDPIILVSDESWHPGLSGLVAGRIKEKFKKPACVITFAENKAGVMEGRGSGRSVQGIHIAQAFIDARHMGLVEKGGGHAMAGGFTVTPDNISKLHAFLIDHIGRQMQNTDANIRTVVDGVLSVRGIDVSLVEMLQQSIGPFGQEHPEPLFMLKNVRVFSADILGTNHVRVMLGDAEGGTRMKAMAFKSGGTPLGDTLLSSGGKMLNVLGTLKINDWQGRKTAEMHITDIDFATETAVLQAATK
jgi:single-stranded-DNA-specific exonuclease